VAATSSGEVDVEEEAVEPQLLFTENNTNFARLYGGTNDTAFVKDAFHDHIIPSHRASAPIIAVAPAADDRQVNGDARPALNAFVNPENKGTKSAAHYVFQDVPGSGGCAVVRMKLTPSTPSKDSSIEDEGLFDDAIEARRQEADEFYNSLVFGPISDDLKQIMRQALGGMLWTKQYYRFIQKEWIEGDAKQPPPPPGRQFIRNRVNIKFIQEEHPRFADKYPNTRNGVICMLKIFCQCQTSQIHGQSTTYLDLTKFQMGVPIFCSLGHGISLHPAGHSRPGFRKETAGRPHEGMVHETRWPDSRLRVEL
jgi:hypothetical protein